MKQSFTLGKKERVKSRKLIDLLFSKGRRISLHPYRVFYLFGEKQLPGADNGLQAGAGAGSRQFKKAVDRNRIKRLTREAWRLQKNELREKMQTHSHSLAVFLIYTGKEMPEFDVLKEAMRLIIEKLLIVADENLSQDT